MPPCLLFTFFPININIDFVINLLFSSSDRYYMRIYYYYPLRRVSSIYTYTADQKKKNQIICIVQTPTAEVG